LDKNGRRTRTDRDPRASIRPCMDGMGSSRTMPQRTSPPQLGRCRNRYTFFDSRLLPTLYLQPILTNRSFKMERRIADSQEGTAFRLVSVFRNRKIGSILSRTDIQSTYVSCRREQKSILKPVLLTCDHSRNVDVGNL